MSQKTRCSYCNKEVLTTALDDHVRNHCRKAPAEAKAGEVNISIPPLSAHIVSTEPEPVIKPTIRRLSANELRVPIPDEYFIIKNSVYSELERVAKMSEASPRNILVTGQQGSGKTSLARQFAVQNNRPFIEVQCGLMSEPGQWFGGLKFAPERGTWYQESQFVRGLETPQCVVLLDELNRVENPKVMNSLFWLLDTRREAWIDDLQRRVTVADGVIFFATLNEGVIFSGIDFVDRGAPKFLVCLDQTNDIIRISFIEPITPFVVDDIIRRGCELGYMACYFLIIT